MKFTKKAFRTWLESKKSRAPVGKPEDRRHCPLCEFLKSQGASDITMDFTNRIVNKMHSINPLWAQKFQIAACDFVNPDTSRGITAKRALLLLSTTRRIKHEY